MIKRMTQDMRTGIRIPGSSFFADRVSGVNHDIGVIHRHSGSVCVCGEKLIVKHRLRFISFQQEKSVQNGLPLT